MDSNNMCKAPLSWSDTLADFLSHVEISQQRQSRPKQIKVNRPLLTFPKETQITEARKLIRTERFHKLTDLKQDKIIGLKLQEFKESLERERHYYKLGFDEETLKRKPKISIINYTATLPNRNTLLSTNKALIPKLKERSFQQLQNTCKVIDKNITREFEKQVRTIDSTSTKESKNQTKGLQLIKRQKEVLNEPSQRKEEKVIKKNMRQKITSPIKTKNVFKSNYVAHKNKQYYFSKWKLFVRLQINKRNEEKKWREKINSFMQRLHERTKVQPAQLHLKEEAPPKSKVVKRNKAKNMECRAEAREQKDTDLKEIVEETLKSRAEAQHQLRPTSVKSLHPNLKGKAKLIGLVAGREKSMEVLNNPLPYTSPPILLTMDQKHEERKKRLADIQEKKRLIDEEKDRQAKVKYEQRLLEAELEKKRKLREFREKLKKQQMDQEKKKEEWRRLKQLNENAISLYNNKLLSQTMNIWRNLWQRRRKLNEIAEKENKSRLQRRVFEAWQEAMKIMEEEKSTKAVALRIKHLKMWAFTQFKELMAKRKFQMQAAEDWYDYLLARKYLKYWVDFLLQEQIAQEDKWNTAVVHYKTKLMAKTLQHWMLLPQILVLEIEKQNRMQEWREKVQQVLPDFRPIISANI